jgi:hypothetical protein
MRNNMIITCVTLKDLSPRLGHRLVPITYFSCSRKQPPACCSVRYADRRPFGPLLHGVYCAQPLYRRPATARDAPTTTPRDGQPPTQGFNQVAGNHRDGRWLRRWEMSGGAAMWWVELWHGESRGGSIRSILVGAHRWIILGTARNFGGEGGQHARLVVSIFFPFRRIDACGPCDEIGICEIGSVRRFPLHRTMTDSVYHKFN